MPVPAPIPVPVVPDGSTVVGIRIEPSNGTSRWKFHNEYFPGRRERAPLRDFVPFAAHSCVSSRERHAAVLRAAAARAPTSQICKATGGRHMVEAIVVDLQAVPDHQFPQIAEGEDEDAVGVPAPASSLQGVRLAARTQSRAHVFTGRGLARNSCNIIEYVDDLASEPVTESPPSELAFKATAVYRHSKASVKAMKRDALMAERARLLAELGQVEDEIVRGARAASDCTVSTASTTWYKMHRARHYAMAPTSFRRYASEVHGPKLARPVVMFPKPGDWVKKDGDL